MDKQLQRNSAKAVRKSLSERDRKDFNLAISKKLASLPVIASAAVIMSYMAFGVELDLALFHQEMLRAGKKLAFPVTYEQRRMEAYIPQGDDAWMVGTYGIRTPISQKSLLVDPKDISLIVVPCVAFDQNKMRIGWGGGYYDRYLPRCTNAYKIGVAYEVQRIEKIAVDSAWDVTLDVILTERNFYE